LPLDVGRGWHTRLEHPAKSQGAKAVTAGVDTFLNCAEAIGLTPLIALARWKEAIAPRRPIYIVAQLLWCANGTYVLNLLGARPR